MAAVHKNTGPNIYLGQGANVQFRPALGRCTFGMAAKQCEFPPLERRRPGQMPPYGAQSLGKSRARGFGALHRPGG